MRVLQGKSKRNFMKAHARLSDFRRCRPREEGLRRCLKEIAVPLRNPREGGTLPYENQKPQAVRACATRPKPGGVNPPLRPSPHRKCFNHSIEPPPHPAARASALSPRSRA
jgi:hypothetical protein